MTLLTIKDLRLSIGDVEILKDIDLSLDAGKVLGIIGESGSGKSMTALSVMNLLPQAAQRGGSILLNGEELLQKSEREMNAIRGREIGMVFQEPMTALDPLKTIGHQVAETILVHGAASRRDAYAEADRVLERVGLPRDRFPRDRFPHELSGGQRQRVVIASAIALKPKLLIADEPTTALDVTTQARILELLRRLVDEDGMGLMFITHDLAVVADLADAVAVMRQGDVVEAGPTREVFRTLAHPYTKALFEASSHVPPRDPSLPGGPPVLEVSGVVRDYRIAPTRMFGPAGAFRAVDDVSFTIERGENVGLVGESGSGKSTLARALMALEAVQAGTITLDGKPLSDTDLEARRKLQVVFQDPYGSFNPRQRVDTLITEPFHLLGGAAPRGEERQRRIDKALTDVGLSPSDAHKYIHEFSGGQRQRIAIARALIIEPSLIILDEAVSALDVSIRAQILDLLAELSDRLEISYLFISHDLSVVRSITDRVLVMKSGKIVESGKTEDVFRDPQHPYTQELLAATPSLERSMAGA
ncbi:MAG: ABC transporter ATP-binding protein [Hyphomicrobiales bacterium]|nr:MAG: ABC transporter ATP-binding protein [Hyphomicrobiales bacterium]